MKQPFPPDVDLILDRAIADGRRRRFLRDCQSAAVRRLARWRRVQTLVVMTLCIIGPATVFLACMPVPDGRDMRTSAAHRTVLEQSNMLISVV